MTAKDPIELTGGRWIQRRNARGDAVGPKVWVEDKPERIELIDFGPLYILTGVLCECGCLLRDESELCPECVVGWIRDAERRGFALAWEQLNRREARAESQQKGAA